MISMGSLRSRGLRAVLLTISVTHLLFLYHGLVNRIDGSSPRSKAREMAARLEGLAYGGLLGVGGSHGRQTPFMRLEDPSQGFVDQDGLLYFQPASATRAILGSKAYGKEHKQLHPILYLMQRAEKQWQAMLERQSKTLDQAAEEYRRRYNRNPPLGFDIWWQFCQGEGVKLPDEYDTIMDNLEPFFALSPDVLRARAEELASDLNSRISIDSFTYEIKGHKASISGRKDMIVKSSRARGFVDFMSVLEPLLPDIKITITSHDGANQLISGEAKVKYAEYAKEGTYLTAKESLDKLDPRSNGSFGWSAGCPPSSNIRASLYGNTIIRPSTHSFVADVSASSDVCRNPDIQTLHGVFLTGTPEPRLLYPHFAWTKTTSFSDIIVTPIEQYYRETGPDPEWEEKTQNKLLWRGATTGLQWNKNSRWRNSQRARLVLLGTETSRNLEVHYSEADGSVASALEDVGDFAKRTMNVAFAGKPAQCIEKDGTCAAMYSTFNFTERMGPAEQNQHKYIFDMDGNGWSGRFHQLMTTNSAILKSTAMPEWYSKRIMPWVHFVPVKIDYTDLHDILAFFIGDETGEKGRDDLGERIGRQGKEWAATYWREVDMQAYMLRLLLEYNRLLKRTAANPTIADYLR